MLVLSRRPNERIAFPTLGITVEVCSVKGNVVRVGISAPSSIPIMREEIGCKVNAPASPAPRHQMRNRLNTATLAIHLAQKQLRAGLEQEAGQSLAEALDQFTAMEQELAGLKDRSKRGIRALLVDDNRNESALLAEFLRLHGILVETVADGQEALDYLKAHGRPDVVLLDMRMPRCDGPATLAAIRCNKALADLKVFAVSGADPGECDFDQGTRGVDGWFTKPINPARLVQEMNQAVILN